MAGRGCWVLAESSVRTVDLSSYMWFLKHGGLRVVRLTWHLEEFPQSRYPKRTRCTMNTVVFSDLVLEVT